MANLFPLILNTTSSTIQELPAGDNLDLSGSNISNVANITSAANVTASYFLGNGSQLTGISISSLANGTSNVSIPAVNGNVVISSAGNANIFTVSGTGVFVSSNANIVNTNLVKFGETVLAGVNTGASITPDVSTGTIFRYTANSNFTFSSLTNAVAGTSATVIITQDGTGSRLLTSTMKFAGASKTLSTTAGAIDIIGVFYDGTTYYASLTKGYA